jgi:hypothetical protein
VTVNVPCGVCGVDFCLPDALYNTRRNDGHYFYCPNGHRLSYRPSAQEKRIEELQRELAGLEGDYRQATERADELLAQREELVGALRQCPGCDWRSRRQIARDPVAMGRGLERVRQDLAEHLVQAHGARPQSTRELVAHT